MANMGTQDIDKYLRNVNFPADKREIVNNARNENAPDDVVRNLDMLPDKRFNSAEDVRMNMEKGSRMGTESTGQGYSTGSSGMGTSGRESSSRTGSSSQKGRY